MRVAFPVAAGPVACRVTCTGGSHGCPVGGPDGAVGSRPTAIRSASRALVFSSIVPLPCRYARSRAASEL